MGTTTSTLLSEEIEDISRRSRLPQDAVKRLYKRFQKLDRAHSGSLEPDDLLMIPELAMNPLEGRFVALFGNLNFRQFVDLIAVFGAAGRHAEKLDFVFRIYDVDGDGFVSEADLASVLRMLVGDNMDVDTVESVAAKVVNDADTDGDGRISRHEFTEAVDIGEVVRRFTVQL